MTPRVVVAALVAFNVALAGMRSITFVQAFQYWVKLFAIAFPACLLRFGRGCDGSEARWRTSARPCGADLCPSGDRAV